MARRRDRITMELLETAIDFVRTGFLSKRDFKEMLDYARSNSPCPVEFERRYRILRHKARLESAKRRFERITSLA